MASCQSCDELFLFSPKHWDRQLVVHTEGRYTFYSATSSSLPHFTSSGLFFSHTLTHELSASTHRAPALPWGRIPARGCIRATTSWLRPGVWNRVPTSSRELPSNGVLWTASESADNCLRGEGQIERLRTGGRRVLPSGMLLGNTLLLPRFQCELNVPALVRHRRSCRQCLLPHYGMKGH